jgi:probable F420-dependent oxidoreductase
VKFGITTFVTADGMTPAALARMLEEHGQDSMFVTEHTHVPASRETHSYSTAKLPRRVAHTLDPFVALSSAATVTSRLRVGTGLCLVVDRDPITTAKEVASLDRLSGGRFDFGVALGWSREEMRNHGTDPRTRVNLMTERMLAMEQIWTHDSASFHGEFVDFEDILLWPKPAQRPYPPVIVGGDGPTVLDRVLRFGDAWAPNWHLAGEQLEARVAELRARAERPVEVLPFGVPADPKELERCERLGLVRAIHMLPTGGKSVVEAALERWEAAIAEFIGS